MTMAEIDRLRGEARGALELARQVGDGHVCNVGLRCGPCFARAKLEEKRAAVEAALRQWWDDLERHPRCLARLTWGPGVVGHSSECARCGTQRHGVTDPEQHPFCTSRIG